MTLRPERAGRPARVRPAFFTGVNYWPAGSGHAMWRAFDAGEIAEDLAHMAALGLDTVRCFVRWDDFQPELAGADPVMLERLERFVSLVAEAGLRAIPVLFTGFADGEIYLPARAREGRGAGDLYRGALLEAQVAFARVVGDRLRGHAGLRAWDFGNAFDRVRPLSNKKLSTGEHSSEPVDERAVAEWALRIARELKGSSGLPVTCGTDLEMLVEDRAVRFGTLCLPLSFAAMQGESVRAPFSRSRLDPEVVPFLAMVAAGFSHLDVAVTSFGASLCPDGKFSAFERYPAAGEPAPLEIAADDTAFATYPCLTDDEAATYATGVLERLQADGRLGALWWRWRDPAPEAARHAPFERRPELRLGGLLTASGEERPVARAFAAFARERRTVPRADDLPAIAAAYYYRTLPTSSQTLYESYLRFVEGRRATAASGTAGNGPSEA